LKGSRINGQTFYSKGILGFFTSKKKVVVNADSGNVFVVRAFNVFRAKQFSSAVYLHVILTIQYLSY